MGVKTDRKPGSIHHMKDVWWTQDGRGVCVLGGGGGGGGGGALSNNTLDRLLECSTALLD